ncbi:hypothetical protein FPV67DRAFT_1743884 [Lyophyllum atratum]|nr:hypothetical protein FPV67DRAFT_1743884 [Lyophyllum atratum]
MTGKVILQVPGHRAIAGERLLLEPQRCKKFTAEGAFNPSLCPSVEGVVTRSTRWISGIQVGETESAKRPRARIIQKKPAAGMEGRPEPREKTVVGEWKWHKHAGYRDDVDAGGRNGGSRKTKRRGGGGAEIRAKSYAKEGASEIERHPENTQVRQVPLARVAVGVPKGSVPGREDNDLGHTVVLLSSLLVPRRILSSVVAWGRGYNPMANLGVDGRAMVFESRYQGFLGPPAMTGWVRSFSKCRCAS